MFLLLIVAASGCSDYKDYDCTWLAKCKVNTKEVQRGYGCFCEAKCIFNASAMQEILGFFHS